MVAFSVVLVVAVFIFVVGVNFAIVFIRIVTTFLSFSVFVNIRGLLTLSFGFFGFTHHAGLILVVIVVLVHKTSKVKEV